MSALAEVMIERMVSDRKGGHLPGEFEPQIVVPVVITYLRGIWRMALVSYNRKKYEKQVDLFLGGSELQLLRWFKRGRCCRWRTSLALKEPSGAEGRPTASARRAQELDRAGGRHRSSIPLLASRMARRSFGRGGSRWGRAPIGA